MINFYIYKRAIIYVRHHSGATREMVEPHSVDEKKWRIKAMVHVYPFVDCWLMLNMKCKFSIENISENGVTGVTEHNANK